MGGMLARAFAQTASDNVYIYNRSRPKAQAVAADFTNIVVCDSWQSLIHQVDAVFLCTKGGDGLALMQTLGRTLTASQLLVTTISGIDLDRWREFTDATPVKLIPSLTQTVHQGVILLSYPRQMTANQRDLLEERLSRIGKPFVIDEAQVRVCSDLASCGPAFMATICNAWAQAAAQTGQLDRAMAESLLQEMVVGFAALIEDGMRFDDIVRRIRVPGGVTERGIESMGDSPKRLFTKLHKDTIQFARGGHRISTPDPFATPHR